MDLARQLKQGMNTGTILFGQRQTMGACSKGDARMVLVAANCPKEYISNLQSKHPDVPIHHHLLSARHADLWRQVQRGQRLLDGPVSGWPVPRPEPRAHPPLPF